MFLDLTTACKMGDIEKTKTIMSFDPSSLHRTTEDAMTPIHWSTMEGHIELTEYLIKMGAQLEVETETEHYVIFL